VTNPDLKSGLTKTMNDIRPGKLYVMKDFDFEVKFCPVKDGKIENHKYWSDWIFPSKHLMCVESFVYSRETVTGLALGTAMATVMAMRTQESATATAMATVMATVMAMARKEFNETKKIRGHVFLTADAKQIWISHYDSENALKKA